MPDLCMETKLRLSGHCYSFGKDVKLVVDKVLPGKGILAHHPCLASQTVTRGIVHRKQLCTKGTGLLVKRNDLGLRFSPT